MSSAELGEVVARTTAMAVMRRARLVISSGTIPSRFLGFAGIVGGSIMNPERFSLGICIKPYPFEVFLGWIRKRGRLPVLIWCG